MLVIWFANVRGWLQKFSSEPVCNHHVTYPIWWSSCDADVAIICVMHSWLLPSYFDASSLVSFHLLWGFPFGGFPIYSIIGSLNWSLEVAIVGLVCFPCADETSNIMHRFVLELLQISENDFIAILHFHVSGNTRSNLQDVLSRSKYTTSNPSVHSISPKTMFNRCSRWLIRDL